MYAAVYPEGTPSQTATVRAAGHLHMTPAKASTRTPHASPTRESVSIDVNRSGFGGLPNP